MSSRTKFKCDFCGGTIVKAAKAGARGYCGKVRASGVDWDIDPFAVINGPHICEECVTNLIASKAFNSISNYMD